MRRCIGERWPQKPTQHIGNDRPRTLIHYLVEYLVNTFSNGQGIVQPAHQRGTSRAECTPKRTVLRIGFNLLAQNLQPSVGIGTHRQAIEHCLFVITCIVSTRQIKQLQRFAHQSGLVHQPGPDGSGSPRAFDCFVEHLHLFLVERPEALRTF